MRCAAVIPARGGSKRLPRKNLYPVLGRPMLSWVIETCLTSGVFEQVIVSSEDEEILNTAKVWGAISHRRPVRLSDDFTHVGPVIEECVASMETPPDVVCLIYSTSILVSTQDLIQSKKLILSDGVRSVLSITEFESPIQRAYEMNQEMEISMIQPEFSLTRTQDLPKFYRDNGGFYWFTRDGSGERDIGYIMPKQRSVDIDTADDMELAVALFNHQKRNEGL